MRSKKEEERRRVKKEGVWSETSSGEVGRMIKESRMTAVRGEMKGARLGLLSVKDVKGDSRRECSIGMHLRL